MPGGDGDGNVTAAKLLGLRGTSVLAVAGEDPMDYIMEASKLLGISKSDSANLNYLLAAMHGWDTSIGGKHFFEERKTVKLKLNDEREVEMPFFGIVGRVGDGSCDSAACLAQHFSGSPGVQLFERLVGAPFGRRPRACAPTAAEQTPAADDGRSGTPHARPPLTARAPTLRRVGTRSG